MNIQATGLHPKMVPKTTSLNPKIVSKTTSLYPNMFSKTATLNITIFSETWRVLEPPPSTWRSLFENCEKKKDYRNIFHTIWFHSNFQGLIIYIGIPFANRFNIFHIVMLKPNSEQLVEILISSRGLSQTLFFHSKMQANNATIDNKCWNGNRQVSWTGGQNK